MKAVVTVMPLAGHVNPTTGLVAELICGGVIPRLPPSRALGSSRPVTSASGTSYRVKRAWDKGT
jgi:hypothetical protein